MVYVGIILMWIVALLVYHMVNYRPKPKKTDLNKEFFDHFMETFNEDGNNIPDTLKRLRANEIINELKNKRGVKVINIQQELVDYHIYLEEKKGNNNPNIKWIEAFIEQYLKNKK